MELTNPSAGVWAEARSVSPEASFLGHGDKARKDVPVGIQWGVSHPPACGEQIPSFDSRAPQGMGGLCRHWSLRNATPGYAALGFLPRTLGGTANVGRSSLREKLSSPESPPQESQPSGKMTGEGMGGQHDTQTVSPRLSQASTCSPWGPFISPPNDLFSPKFSDPRPLSRKCVSV